MPLRLFTGMVLETHSGMILENNYRAIDPGIDLDGQEPCHLSLFQEVLSRQPNALLLPRQHFLELLCRQQLQVMNVDAVNMQYYTQLAIATD